MTKVTTLKARVGAATLAATLLCTGVARAHDAGAEDERAAASASAEYIERRLDELRRLMRELEAKSGDLREDIFANAARREALTTQIEELEAVLGQAESRLNAAEGSLSSVQAKLDEKNAEVARTERALQLTIRKLEIRAVAMYKQGPASLFEMVMGADGITGLLRRVAVTLRLVRADNERVRTIARQKARLVAAAEQIERLRDKAAHDAAHVRVERNRVAGVRHEVDSQRAAVSDELGSQYAKLGDIEEQKRQYAEETRQLQAESAAIAAFLRGQTDSPPTVSPNGMSWPVRGPVTSGYGWRTHPVLGGKRFHAGIDIGVPAGTSIGAAASGKVIFAGQKTGYGNTVIVYHGGDIATLYAHMSRIGASSGAQVVRGQSVGAVGCTGYCTGPHLHFEVRVDGNPVDPMGWLP